MEGFREQLHLVRHSDGSGMYDFVSSGTLVCGSRATPETGRKKQIIGELILCPASWQETTGDARKMLARSQSRYLRKLHSRLRAAFELCGTPPSREWFCGIRPGHIENDNLEVPSTYRWIAHAFERFK